MKYPCTHQIKQVALYQVALQKSHPNQIRAFRMALRVSQRELELIRRRARA